jgi:hypothetical protein
MPTMTEAQLKAQILLALDTNPLAVEKALVLLYRRQTAGEQMQHETVEDNGVGFNGIDAPFCSSLAEWVLKGRHLSEKQLAFGRKKVRKYVGQLMQDGRIKMQEKGIEIVKGKNSKQRELQMTEV